MQTSPDQTVKKLDAVQEIMIKLLDEYLKAGPDKTGLTPIQQSGQLDSERKDVIQQELLPLLDGYFAGRVPLPEFKSKIDSINKRHSCWGFKGIKGQMFFNMMTSVAADQAECNAEIKSAITCPENEDIARSRLRNFTSYVKRVSDDFLSSGGTKAACPKAHSVPFFLTYFWQIQAPTVWPIFYTKHVDVLSDLNIWQKTGDNTEDYITFKHIHDQLVVLFSNSKGRQFSITDVEHVVWHRAQNHESDLPVDPPTTIAKTPDPISGLPDSFVPPIIAILPRLARNDESLEPLATASGISVDRAFEKSVNAAFNILGYETKLLGQGTGRTPDGVAISTDHAYAIIWDAKSRSGPYGIGTDDRAIREYVATQSKEFKKRRFLRNIYYCIVSSSFTHSFDDLIRNLKMETDISEVCLLEADALVALVDAKLRDSLQFSLGSDGLQRFFCDSGILSAQDAREMLC